MEGIRRSSITCPSMFTIDSPMTIHHESPTTPTSMPDIPDGMAQNDSCLPQVFNGPSVTTTMVAESKAMRTLLAQAEKFARAAATVLVTGESGTGKEVIARWIHRQSPRNLRPYVRVNCAALPESLAESELFGHERGAFTGAVSARPGRFTLAGKGSILLDEISEISLPMQAKLLRVLEEGEYHALGSGRVQIVAARVIATSNRCLKSAVDQGIFREDLFYRLNVLRLNVPPLRERPDDVSALARYFVEIFREREGTSVTRISDSAMAKLQAFDWPGNVRQLRNVIHRSCVVSDQAELTPHSIDFSESHVRESPHAHYESLTLKDAERELIIRSLKRNDGNKSAAARELGVTPRTLLNKMKQYRELGVVDAA